jgi:hypothetical protein
MSTQKAFLLAAIVLMSVSVARADLILTLNGTDTSDFPLIIWNVGDLLVAVAGSTQIEPNDVSVSAIGGVLEPVPDANHQYYFEFNSESSEATVSLVTNLDMVIDGNSVAAGTTIYELYLFYNRQQNILAACGLGLEDLLPLEQGTGSQESTMSEELLSPSETSALAITEGTVAEEENTSYNFVPVTPYAEQKQQEKLKSLKYCPPAKLPEVKAEPLLTNENMGSESVLSESYENGMLLDGGVVIVDSDITSNTIWTADNTYHVVANINVQALLVVEPGTVVAFAYDTGMFINNGGTLISCGTPDNPVIYTSDSEYPDYADYYCPIYIEETASSLTKVAYSCIEWAYAGIVILNKKLDTNIENNYFYSNVYGIVEQGIDHTDITNDLFYGSAYGAIEIYMESLSGEASSDSQIYIQNNTCDYSPQWDGISVYGVPEAEDAGFVFLGNNLVSNNGRYGLVLANGYMYASVLNTGYYGNAYNKNWEFEEENPVIETDWPYRDGTGYLPICYLDQNCGFINAGYEYIEQTHLIGMTTDTDDSPDCNKTDIGFHYPNWNFSNAGNATDLNSDLIVDFKDFAILANGWQTAYDMADLATMASEWLRDEPNIEINIYGDSSTGYVDVGINGFTSNTQRVFLLIDGEYIGEMFFFEDGETLNVDISYLGPGTHQLKVVSISDMGRVTCSNLKDSTFNCFLNYCFCADAYDSNEPHYFCAYYPGAENVFVKVYNEENSLVWSQTYTGQNLNGFIPAGITLADDLDSIKIEEAGGMMLAGSASVTKPLAVKFKPGKVPANIRALIIVPSWWMRHFSDYGVIEAVKGAFEARGVPYDYLKGSDASYNVLAWYGANRSIEYIYYCQDGGYITNGVLRTKIQLSDGIAYSVKQSDFAPGTAPSWCEKLPGGLETTANSIYRIGFAPGQLKFVHFDCCWTGRLKLTGDGKLIEGPEGQQGLLATYQNDMSCALGMQSGETQVYQGWWNKFEKGELTEFDLFAYHEWTKLGEGDNLYDALTYAINHTDWVPDGPHDNYRLMGQGDITDLRIE